MGYTGVTPYLGLRLIRLKSESWYSDMHMNLERIDRLGRNFQMQARDGHRAAIRVGLQDGTLVDAIAIDPRSDGTLRITIGRLNAADTVTIAGSIRASTFSLVNQNSVGFGRDLRLSADYALNADVDLRLDTQQSTDTLQAFPIDDADAVEYLGSSFQLESARAEIVGRVPYVMTVVTTVGGVETEFVIPAYKRT